MTVSGVPDVEVPVPPYNMALAGEPSEKNVKAVRLGLDMVRLSGWLPVRIDLDELPGRIWGVDHRRGPRPGRLWGSAEARIVEVWSGARKGEKGRIYWRGVKRADLAAVLLDVRFNPQDVKWADVVRTWHRLGQTVGRCCVREVHASFDYAISRDRLILDDPRRLSDRWGCGPRGCETEASGYRRGSRVKHRVYDKVAEAASRGEQLSGHLTRAEFVWLPTADELEATELGAMAWPWDPVTVRFVEWEPEEIGKAKFAALVEIARGSGMRACRHHAKQLLGATQREQLFGCVLPEVEPSPRAWFEREWPSVVERDFVRPLRAVA